MKVKIIFILIFLLSLSKGKGQDGVINSAGEVSSSSNYTMQWSLGELVVGANQGLLYSNYQGFFVISQTTLSTFPDVDFNVYPNPCANQLILENKNITDNDLSYSLYNIEGDLIMENPINEPTMILPFEGLLPTTYILNIVKENTIVSTHKIIKK